MTSRTIIPIAILLLVSGLSLLGFLGSDSLRSWDEAVYAQCAKEMVQGGDWLTIHWNGEKFFQKPPLFIWSTAVLYKLFGVSELTSRLIAAISGIGTVILTFLLARLFFNRHPAFIASVMLLTSPAFFIFSRSGMTDSTLTFFIVLALYAYLKTSNPLYWYVVGTALGLAILTKGAAALLAALVICGAAIGARAKSKHVWFALVLFIAIGSSWHIVMVSLYGVDFLREYIGVQVLARAVRTVDVESYGPFYYVPMLGVSVFLLPFALWRVHQKRDIRAPVIVLALLTLALFAIVKTKHAWYILPALPMISTIIAPSEGSKIKASAYWMLVGLNIILLCFVVTKSRMDTPAHKDLAELAMLARHNTGTLGVFPDLDFGPEILFYSNRRLCSEAEHTMASMTHCSPSHIITTKRELESLSRRYALIPVAERGEFVYVQIQ